MSATSEEPDWGRLEREREESEDRERREQEEAAWEAQDIVLQDAARQRAWEEQQALEQVEEKP